MDVSPGTRRWPAYAVAALFLAYAVGKAAFALESRLGLPGGPVVSAAEHERYARDVMGVATAQWSAAASGVAGACLALATVTPPGRRVPRPLMLLALAVLLLAAGAGATIMVLDGFVGLGVGWQWYHGILGLVAISLLLAMTRSYLVATRHVAA
ncbi:hypothetical protein OG777_21995 [Micromonospora peucetia]|uniref:DUF998 domain-containing protein n=1 Tax=Micromonospora peucetia TaxID=47871 RepID=A0A1C6VC40_9ACTN|nr:hypothetical protein [Micromonospora peucetia]MCX4389582.1 hypothetical protein [Micromonospora peucetia]WSA30067.1 hypothetical protein OIE14_17755 [Micromonospora peucetia]SCL63912.1 hypothetical protein GA0070608_2871 [Micromonospora peucetia]